MKLEKETSIYQLGAIGGIQATAESKNSVFYQATAPPTTGRKVNDIWYDSDDGNAMYKFDGTQWVQTQFGTNAIVAGSVTAAKLNSQDVYTNFLLTNFVQAAQASFSSLSAITADIGTCTAGKVQSSDYSYTSGNYSTAGMQIDLNNKVYRTPNTAILADGSFYTKSGTIGPWTISASGIYNGKAATYDGNNGTHVGIYGISGENDNGYYVLQTNGILDMVSKTSNGGWVRIANANDQQYSYLSNTELVFINYSATNPEVFHVHSTGNVSLSGTLTAGGNLYTSAGIYTGGRTAANDGKPGFYANAAGNVFMVGDTNAGAYIYFYYNKATANTAYIHESASGVLSFSAPNGFKVPNVYNATDTVAANVIVQSDGRLVRRSTSSKRYKHDIKVLRDYKKVLDIPVVSFVYNNGYLDSKDQRYMRDVPGFIAEDVAEHYPIAADWVDGRIEDWNARFIIPPMLAVEQDHERRIRKLEEAIK